MGLTQCRVTSVVVICIIILRQFLIIRKKMDLLSLPTEVIGAEVCKWLDVKSLVCLDTAVTSLWRETYLHIYQYLAPDCVEKLSLNMTSGKMKWLMERNMTLTNLSFAKRLQAESIGKILLYINKETSQHLKTIQFNGNTSVEDYHLIMLSNKCHRLTSLYLWNCKNITDIGLIHLAKTNPMISELDLWCTFNPDAPPRSLSDEFVYALAANCPNLTFLNVSGCFNITNQAVLSLSNGCPKLYHLNISRCHQVTNEAILSLLKCCLSLSMLKIQECQNLLLPHQDSTEILDQALQTVPCVFK